MICYVTVDYEFTALEKESGAGTWNTPIPQEKWNALRNIIPSLREKAESTYHINEAHLGKILVNLRECAKITAMGFKFTVVAFPGGQVTTLKDKIEELVEQNVLDNLEQALNGGHVHIHVADSYLMKMDEVQFIEDACTDLIQTELDKGWKMLCICPPNAQRRPTYIMGRISPKL